MNKTALAILFSGIVLIGYPTVNVIANGFKLPSIMPTYELVMEYKSDRFVVDHGMTIADCVDELPRSDPYHHVSFSCELED